MNINDLLIALSRIEKIDEKVKLMILHGYEIGFREGVLASVKIAEGI